MKKILSLILATIMMIGCMSIVASAATADTKAAKTYTIFLDQQLRLETGVKSGATVTSNSTNVVVKKTYQNQKIVFMVSAKAAGNYRLNLKIGEQTTRYDLIVYDVVKLNIGDTWKSSSFEYDGTLKKAVSKAGIVSTSLSSKNGKYTLKVTAKNPGDVVVYLKDGNSKVVTMKFVVSEKKTDSTLTDKTPTAETATMFLDQELTFETGVKSGATLKSNSSNVSVKKIYENKKIVFVITAKKAGSYTLNYTLNGKTTKYNLTVFDVIELNAGDVWTSAAFAYDGTLKKSVSEANIVTTSLTNKNGKYTLKVTAENPGDVVVYLKDGKNNIVTLKFVVTEIPSETLDTIVEGDRFTMSGLSVYDEVVLKGNSLKETGKNYQFDAVDGGQTKILCYLDDELVQIIEVNVKPIRIVGCSMKKNQEAEFICYDSDNEEVGGIYWKSSNTSIATVSTNGGKVESLKAGTCQIQVLSYRTDKVLATYTLVVK